MMVIACLLSAAAFIGGIGLTVSSAWLITMASQHPPILTLTVAIVMVRFFGISRSAARYTERVVSHKAVFDRLSTLRSNLYNSITGSSIRFVRDFNSGSAVKAIVDDVERAQEYQLRITLPRYAAILTLITGTLLGWWISPDSLVITIPALIILLFVLPTIISRICEEQARTIEESENSYSRSLEESTHGIVEAQIYGYLDQSIAMLHENELTIHQIEKKLLARTRSLSIITQCVISISLVSFVYIAWRGRSESGIPAVQVAMLIFLPLVLFEAITSWYPNLFAAGKLLMSQHSVEALLRREISQENDNQPEHINKLIARHLKVSWNQDFMKPVDFSLARGEHMVIRGRSGSGKSTLAMGLLGLLEYSGSLTDGEHELREYGDLSSHIVGTVQQSHIFNTSVRENMKIASPEANDNEIINVLRIVELESLINELPGRLDCILGQTGRVLSGGESKRLAVARALLSGAEVVILDEPTEHLDSALANRIEEKIIEYCQEKILIVVTHSGWHHIDKTLHMER
jgi:thiol reductant ABC exporter CydC subunit